MLDVSQLYKELDSMFAAHTNAQEIEKYLMDALHEANCAYGESQESSEKSNQEKANQEKANQEESNQEESNQEKANAQALQLSVLNELMGFYRSRGEHTKNKPIIDNALDLAKKMDLAGSEAGTTTLINAATSLRAAGDYERAKNIYNQALKEAAKTLGPKNRKLAALHNNLSMLYSETGSTAKAVEQLKKALEILEETSLNTSTDIDVAATHTNIALAILQEAREAQEAREVQETQEAQNSYPSLVNLAFSHAQKSIDIYKAGGNQNQPHYASALAGFAQVQYAMENYTSAAQSYKEALDLIAQCYGEDSESYAITLENLRQAQKAAEKFTAGGVADAIQCAAEKSQATTQAQPESNKTTQSNKNIKAENNPKIKNGMQLAKEYWQTYGKPLLELPKFKDYKNRIAAGLAGHGSECYGFDDEISRDHDFGPGFCLWLTDEDYAEIGDDLQATYDSLPQEFAGFGSRKETPRAKSCEGSKRVGVFSISEFFENITGFSAAPSQNEPHLWLSLSESTLAAATNGQIFADPLGEFSKARQSFKLMPDDVRISLISRRLGMMAQAGQYNVPRMLARKDGAAAWLSINEFVHATASIVFLLNNPISAGYLPYYKWQFAALRKLSARMASRLSGVCNQLESLMRLSSAACFGGIGFGEGTKGSSEAESKINEIIQNVCNEVVQELKYQGLSDCSETFLEWQRPYVEAHINSRATCLRSL